MRFGILGGGFGLYGYLPAAIQSGFSVSTLNRYRSFISARSELADLAHKVNFLDDESELLNGVDYLVVARDPSTQSKLLSKRSGQFKMLFLEKPLGTDIEVHTKCLEKLIITKQNFSVGYLMPYTAWFKSLDLSGDDNLEIHWNCVINSSSWKSNSFPDRGLFTYFGIHLIPLIYAIKPKSIEIEKLPKQQTLNIRLKTNTGVKNIFLSEGDRPGFKIMKYNLGLKTVEYESETPFGGQGSKGIPDPRIPLLKEYLEDGFNNSGQNESIAYEKLFLEISSHIAKLY